MCHPKLVLRLAGLALLQDNEELRNGMSIDSQGTFCFWKEVDDHFTVEAPAAEHNSAVGWFYAAVVISFADSGCLTNMVQVTKHSTNNGAVTPKLCRLCCNGICSNLL